MPPTLSRRLTIDEIQRLRFPLLEHLGRRAPWPAHADGATARSVAAWHAAQGIAHLWLVRAAEAAGPETAFTGQMRTVARAHYTVAGLLLYAVAHRGSDTADALAAHHHRTADAPDPAVPVLDRLTSLAGEAFAERAAGQLAADLDRTDWEIGLERLADRYDVHPDRVLDDVKAEARVHW